MMKKDLLYNFAELVLTDSKLKKLMKRSDYNAYISLKNNNGEMSFDLADKIATAIGRSYKDPSFFVSAGARLIVIFSTGKLYPLFFMADLTLCFDSLIAVSARPTIS
jgi:hypothetical protein